MTKLDIIQEIQKEGSRCHQILKTFKVAKLTLEDILKLRKRGTPLHYAVRFGKGDGILELVEYLVELDPESVNNVDEVFGNLALHTMPSSSSDIADQKNQRDQLEARHYLMKKNPDGLKTKNTEGRTPLEEAKYQGCNIIAKHIAEFQEGYENEKKKKKQEKEKLKSEMSKTKDKQSATKSKRGSAKIDAPRIDNPPGHEKSEKSNVRVQCLEEARKAEAKIIDKLNDEFPVPFLKSMLQSLMQRLETLKEHYTPTEKGSMEQYMASLLLKESDPRKDAIVSSIKKINKQLLELEATATATEASTGPNVAERTEESLNKRKRVQPLRSPRSKPTTLVL